MEHIMTITKYANGISVESTDSCAVFENTHAIIALQSILDRILGWDSNLVVQKTPEDKAQTADLLAALVNQSNHNPVCVSIDSCGQGFIVEDSTQSGNSRVYEKSSIPALMQDLASTCFPGLKVTLEVQ